MEIFLGTPSTGIINRNLKEPLESATKSRIMEIISDLRQHGHNVFCALEEEEFGKKVADSIECTHRDYSLIKQSNLYITFPNNSFGCAVELGWASAHSIPIVLGINKRIGSKTPLYEGLQSTGTQVHIVYYDSENEFPDRSEWKKILKYMEEYVIIK